MENHLDKITVLDELCEKHGIPLWQFPYMSQGQEHISKMCQACTQEQIAMTEQETLEEARNRQTYVTTYDILMRDSTVPEELRGATFENFKAETAEEKQLLEFARGQAEKYLAGLKANTLITGSTGIGKSHLSIAMAKAINEGYRAKGEPKSVLFVNLTELVKKIKEGWNYGQGAKLTEFEAVELLKSVDYLILDDLGAKNAIIKPKSDWEQDLLFDILNSRENTIINTNLSGSELKTVYNERNYSRILKGLEGNSFKAFTIKDKRYSINRLKQGEQTK
ncbi:TPA: ATP-binding protein [Streptococcus suis]|nr:ATP-binding protein [Streptococcus suis]HEM6420204.1 ATP-binding protein [Streptococcus suis]HEM6426479.1 ATP-binding protein [Streptococcus suis]